MPGNRPNPRPPVGVLLIALLLAGMIPAVSAEVYVDEEISKFSDMSISGDLPTLDAVATKIRVDKLRFKNIQNFVQFNYLIIDIPGAGHGTFLNNDTLVSPGRHIFHYSLNGETKEVVVYVERSTDALGAYTHTKLTCFFQDWDIETLSGAQTVSFTDFSPYRGFNSNNELSGVKLISELFPSTGPEIVVYGEIELSYRYLVPKTRYDPVSIYAVGGVPWKNRIYIADENVEDILGYRISISRNVNGELYSSTVSSYFNDNLLYQSTQHGVNIDLWYPIADVNKMVITSPDFFNYTYMINYQEDVIPPESKPFVTVYVQNSQTGALLANSHLSILAAAGGTETEIINATLPGGTATYTLQPTGGGSPNPDYYRAVATVPGFTQIVENHSFTLHGPHDVIIEMRPDSGGPLDPERAYLEFYVRDLNANPIPAVSVQCGGSIRQTNSAGYAVFEVLKNSTHPWIAKKSSYTTIEGTATVADGPRYVVNVVLGPGTVPTNPPATDPGETPGATPTPDTRTNEQKGQEVIDLIADFALPIAILALLATLSGLLSMVIPRRR